MQIHRQFIIVSVVLPVIVVLIWYISSFLAYYKELLTSAERGTISISSIQKQIYPLAVAAETKEGIRSHAIRKAYWSFVFRNNPKSNFSWQLNNLLRYAASHLHFNDQQVFGIWIDCSLCSCGEGLGKTAQEYYGKQLGEPSLREITGLVALVRSPSRFKPGTDQ